jgi:hypothetical protein
MSLYPYVMKYGAFPTGYPTTTTTAEMNAEQRHDWRLDELPWSRPEQNQFKGLILCCVSPPAYMIPRELSPFLPYRTSKGKLIFGLCRTCAETEKQQACTHDNTARSWVSGYTHVELNKALTLGYAVENVYEVFLNFVKKYKFSKFRLNTTRKNNGRIDQRATAFLTVTLISC